MGPAKEMKMAVTKKPLPQSLRKRIKVSDAKPCSLRVQLALPAGESDLENHIVSERLKRVEALVARYGLNANAPHLAEQLVKALVNDEYGVPADSPDWWHRFLVALMGRHIPGFLIERRGRHRKWVFDSLAVLHKDIQSLKKKCPDLSGEEFYQQLRARHPSTWGQFEIPALRKACSEARALARGFPEPTVPPGRRVSAPHGVIR